MNHKLVLTALLISLTLLFSSCGEDPAAPQVETPETTSIATEPTATAQAELASYDYPETVIIREPTEDNPLQFDFDEALNNIYIGNKKISFPETVADLKAGFTTGFSLVGNSSFENKAGDDPEKYIAPYVTINDEIMCNDKKIGWIIAADNLKDYGEKSKIVFLQFEGEDIGSTMQGLYKFRIGQNVTKQDIKDYFGKPTSETEFLLKYIDETRIIAFTVNKGLAQIKFENK